MHEEMLGHHYFTHHYFGITRLTLIASHSLR